MTKKLINPPNLAPPRGFNHAIAASGQFLFLAGQDASDVTGSIVAPDDVVTQYEQILRNLYVIMEHAGGTMQDIVKLNIFVRDRDEYLARRHELKEVHRAYFGDYYPTMALFEVNAFYHDEALIEVEGIAVLEDKVPPDANP